MSDEKGIDLDAFENDEQEEQEDATISHGTALVSYDPDNLVVRYAERIMECENIEQIMEQLNEFYDHAYNNALMDDIHEKMDYLSGSRNVVSFEFTPEQDNESPDEDSDEE